MPRSTKLSESKTITIAPDDILDPFVSDTDRVDRIDHAEREALIEVLVTQARALQG